LSSEGLAARVIAGGNPVRGHLNSITLRRPRKDKELKRGIRDGDEIRRDESVEGARSRDAWLELMVSRGASGAADAAQR
jgi:hypothetical protein